MTYANNFKLPPVGKSAIELSCFYDTCLSQALWEDNFKKVYDRVYQFTDYGQLSDIKDVTWTIKGLKKDIEHLYFDYYGNVQGLKKGELIEYILDGIDPLKEYFDSSSVWTKYDLELIPSKPLNKISVGGYSQGDYAEVIYCPEDVQKSWGKKPSESELKKLFTNYFYDAPIFCRFIINDEEYDYTEFMPSEYEWDREEFAKIASEKSGASYDELLAMLPEYPNYD